MSFFMCLSTYDLYWCSEFRKRKTSGISKTMNQRASECAEKTKMSEQRARDQAQSNPVIDSLVHTAIRCPDGKVKSSNERCCTVNEVCPAVLSHALFKEFLHNGLIVFSHTSDGYIVGACFHVFLFFVMLLLILQRRRNNHKTNKSFSVVQLLNCAVA
jgi:hypothetical protein